MGAFPWGRCSGWRRHRHRLRVVSHRRRTPCHSPSRTRCPQGDGRCEPAPLRGVRPSRPPFAWLLARTPPTSGRVPPHSSGARRQAYVSLQSKRVRTRFRLPLYMWSLGGLCGSDLRWRARPGASGPPISASHLARHGSTRLQEHLGRICPLRLGREIRSVREDRLDN